MANFLAYAADFRGGVNVAVGDGDGDGRAEIATVPETAGTVHVKVLSLPDGAAEPVERVGFFGPPVPPDSRAGVRVAFTDRDGDGLADLLVSPPRADPLVFLGADLRDGNVP